MIEVSHLTKRYGDIFAVNDISFTVDEGEIVGFLGPNGAGKSTTMNILTGYISSTGGYAKIAGCDILDNPSEAKRHIGYLPELPPLYLDMTVKDYLSFIYDLKKATLKKRPHIEEICELVKITDVYGRMIKNLSKGYRQRVGLAQALVGNPDVLILDEPTVGLDPKQINDMRALIKHLGKKHTVILSSHILPEVQSICERVLIINKGRIVADDTAENLSASLEGERRIVARIEGPEDVVMKALRSVPGVRRVTSLGVHEQGSMDYSIESQASTDVRAALFEVLAARHWPLKSLESGDLSLEEIFLKLTGSEPDKKSGKALKGTHKKEEKA